MPEGLAPEQVAWLAGGIYTVAVALLAFGAGWWLRGWAHREGYEESERENADLIRDMKPRVADPEWVAEPDRVSDLSREVDDIFGVVLRASSPVEHEAIVSFGTFVAEPTTVDQRIEQRRLGRAYESERQDSEHTA